MVDGALTGVRIIDFSRVLAGPYCTMMLGEHTDEILRDELDYTDDEIATLRRDGAIGGEAR